MISFDSTLIEERSFKPVPEGDYEFTVVGAKEETSKANNDMLTMQLAVEVGRDKPLTVYECLVFIPNCLWKVKGFCTAVGLDFASGCLSADLAIGQSGTAHCKQGDKNDKGNRYLEVQWYHEKPGYTEQPTSKPPAQSRQQESATTGNHEPPAPDYDMGAEDIPF